MCIKECIFDTYTKLLKNKKISSLEVDYIDIHSPLEIISLMMDYNRNNGLKIY